MSVALITSVKNGRKYLSSVAVLWTGGAVGFIADVRQQISPIGEVRDPRWYARRSSSEANKRAWRRYYASHLPERRKLSLISVKKTTAAKKEFVRSWKAERGCAVCGERDPLVLDLDHLNPDNKHPWLKLSGKIHQRQVHQLSWPALKLELEKCQVLCANCHRRKTHQENQQLRVDYTLVGAVA